jgi:hypothetical protein
MFEAGDAPPDLADLVAGASQGQDGVVDRLGQPVADGVSLSIALLGGDDARVGVVGILIQPAGQRAAQVETDASKVA